MSSDTPNANIPKTVFEHRDYKNLAGKPAFIIAISRPAIKDRLERTVSTDSNKIDFFDLGSKLEELKETEKIFYTDEDGDDDVTIGVLREQDPETIEHDYKEIISTIADECRGLSPIDRLMKMKKIASALTEIELITKKDVLVAVKLGGKYEKPNKTKNNNGGTDKNNYLN